MKLIVSLNESESGTLALVGGKGHNLVNLVHAGFPVPPGFIVTADAYRQFVESLDWLDAELQTFRFDDTARLAKQCAALRSRLAAVKLPPDISQAIDQSLATQKFEESARFAVRSSSTLEDLAQAAFAGQHDTYLNVRSRDVVDKVRDCFVSLWGDRAVLYRHHQGFAQLHARMAVVVQRQVECDRAGVGFSVDPVTGNLRQMVIDANYGLGESVVAGECEVDHILLEKATMNVVSQSIGQKDRMIVPAADGTEEQAVGAALATAPCLAEKELAAVGRLLAQVEGHYGWPQDIEWGLKDGQLYLFQSRAVTTLQPRYTRDESAERFPNAMTPLSWDFLGGVFRESLAHSLQLMGLPPLKEDWFTLIDHYVYGNQNAVELLAAYRPIQAKNIHELAEEIPRLRQRFSWVLELPILWARDLDRYLIRLGRLSATSMDHMSVPEIWKHVEQLKEIATDYFRPNIAISITQSFLHRLLLHLVTSICGKEKGLKVFDGLMAGCDTKTSVVNREMHELALLASKNEALQEALMEKGGRAFCDRNLWPQFPEFEQRFRRFIEDHGHRELDMDYSQPTWSAAPWVALDSIVLMLRQPQQENPAATARLQRLQFSETELAFLSGVPEQLRFFFREMINLARTYTLLDDLEHYQTTRVNPLARQAALTLGRRLAERGIIDDQNDVFFFSAEALGQLVAEFPPLNVKKYREMLYATKASYEKARSETPRWSLDDRAPKVEDTASGEIVRGLSGSPGIVSGNCFLVHSPEDFARFPTGSILVARTTNPAWTPLFYSASGLITESGGPLSHGAVTAREMRLPAVMSVRGVMRLLTNGESVTVDGNQGTIKRSCSTSPTSLMSP
jgi:phosphoenolpyruvate synthase/pyruvate phosphate dikinase